MSEGSEKINGPSGEEAPKGRSPKELKKLYRHGRIAAPQSKPGAPESSSKKSPERAPESEQRAVVLEMLKSVTDFADIRDIMETFVAGLPSESQLEAVQKVLAELPEEKRGIVRDSLKKALKKEDYEKLAEALPASAEVPSAAGEEERPSKPEARADTEEKSEGWKILRREIFDASTSVDAIELFKSLGAEAGMTKEEFTAVMRERVKARAELVGLALKSDTPAGTALEEKELPKGALTEIPSEAVVETMEEIPAIETANVRAAREVLDLLRSELLAKARILKEASEVKQAVTALDMAMIEGRLDERDEELLAISGMSTKEARAAVKKLALKVAVEAGLYEGILAEQNPVAKLREILETTEDLKKKEEIRTVIQEIVRREIHIVAGEVKGLVEIKDPVLLEMMEEEAGRIAARRHEKDKLWERVRTVMRITRRKEQRPSIPATEPKMSAYEQEIAKWVDELKAHPEKLAELKEKGVLPPAQMEEVEKRFAQIKRDEQTKLLKESRREEFDKVRIYLEGGQVPEGEAVGGLNTMLENAAFPLSEEIKERIGRILGIYVKIRAFSDEIRELEAARRA